MRLSNSVLCIVATLAFAITQDSIAAPRKTIFLEQGWTKNIRELFYYTPQGSRLIPYAWFMALEVPSGGKLFSKTENLTRYGLVPFGRKHPLNPGNLPVGLTYERTQSGNNNQTGYLGLTCAACHTTNVRVKNSTIRIDGGQAHFDFDRFYSELTVSVANTLHNPDRFARFAARVLEKKPALKVRDLKNQLAAFKAKIEGEAVIRKPVLASGFGRVDALTQILNALSVTDQGTPTNLRAVNAPTSYPPVWLAPDLEFVQWNPIIASPIGRNGGQVLGVFGKSILSGKSENWFKSSIRLKNLHALEQWIAKLKPPRWNEKLFGKINPELVNRGKKLFRRNCARCHNMYPYRRTDPNDNFFGKSFIRIGRVDYKLVGTDPVYVEALQRRLVRTNPVTATLVGGKTTVPAATYVLNTVGAIVTRAMKDAKLTYKQFAAFNGFRFRKSAAGSLLPYAPPGITDLKASPLAGIWATGPYLHNGSVASVYELLSPVKERRKVFWTGGKELNTRDLGFRSNYAPGRFRFDTRLAGNGNAGHLFPPEGLTPSQRRNIIEYLKTQ